MTIRNPSITALPRKKDTKRALERERGAEREREREKRVRKSIGNPNLRKVSKRKLGFLISSSNSSFTRKTNPLWGLIVL